MVQNSFSDDRLYIVMARWTKLLVCLFLVSIAFPYAKAQESVSFVRCRSTQQLSFLVERGTCRLVVNQTSTAKGMHLVDFLIGKGIMVKVLFALSTDFGGKQMPVKN